MYLVCTCLQFAMRVVGDQEQIESLLGSSSPHAQAACPVCQKTLYRTQFLGDNLADRVQSVLREVTPMEAHLVLEGLGFPEERSCGEDSVKAVLSGKKIVALDLREIRGSGRTVIDSVTMEDGTTVFLNGSGWGALVYRIRRPNPYVSKEST